MLLREKKGSYQECFYAQIFSMTGCGLSANVVDEGRGKMYEILVIRQTSADSHGAHSPVPGAVHSSYFTPPQHQP